MHIEEDKMFTIEEYEKLQHKYKYNIEFINGDVVLHSKTSVKHNEIVNNSKSLASSRLAPLGETGFSKYKHCVNVNMKVHKSSNMEM